MRILALLLLTFVFVAAIEPMTAEARQDDGNSPSTTQPRTGSGLGSILGPGPGEGVEPTDAGDRGGAAQLTLFGVLVAAVGGIGLLVRRDMRRSQRAVDDG